MNQVGFYLMWKCSFGWSLLSNKLPIIDTDTDCVKIYCKPLTLNRNKYCHLLPISRIIALTKLAAFPNWGIEQFHCHLHFKPSRILIISCLQTSYQLLLMAKADDCRILSNSSRNSYLCQLAKKYLCCWHFIRKAIWRNL